MKRDGGFARGWALPVTVVSAVVLLFTGTAVAGVAAVSAVHEQDSLLHRAAEASSVLAQAGRAEALVAAIGDPKTNPATLRAMRLELAQSAKDVQIQSGRWANALSTAVDGQPRDQQFARVVAQSGPHLLEFVAEFAQTASRATAADARLAPGQLIRGSLDGIYPVLRKEALAVHAGLRTLATDAATRWTHLVSLVFAGMGAAGTALSAVMLGPVRSRLLRQRQDADRAEAARQETLSAVRRVLDTLDVPVLVTDSAGTHVTANAAARNRLSFLTSERTAVADLPSALFGRAGCDDLVGWDGLPLLQALHAQAPVSALLTFPAPLDLGAAQPGVARVTKFSVDAHPLADSDGRLIGAVASFYDVTELHARVEYHARHAAQLAAIGRATSAILRQEDARAAVCDAARTVVGASFATLFEDDGHGDLVCTAAVGADVFGMRLPIDGHSVTATVFSHARPHLVAALHGEPDLDPQAVDALSQACGTPLQAGAWIPVVAGGRCRAVLGLGFPEPVHFEDHLPTLQILAGEAAVALDRQDLIRRLAHDAELDPLTGAANRRVWEQRLTEAVAASRACDQPLSMIILDLDHFKTYNDTHGHPAGDALLRRTVRAWLDRLRPSDTLARYGGEEFAVLLPGCTLQAAFGIAEDLRRLVPNGQSCSAGVAELSSLHDHVTLVAEADQALYSAKRSGRDCTMTGPDERIRRPGHDGDPAGRA